jgi:hypothetical protein
MREISHQAFLFEIKKERGRDFPSPSLCKRVEGLSAFSTKKCRLGPVLILPLNLQKSIKKRGRRVLFPAGLGYLSEGKDISLRGLAD